MNGILKPNAGQDHFVETVAYLLIAMTALGSVYLLCYFSPVVYVRLITEDQWGEYGTAASFGLAGILLLLVALKSDSFASKLLWALAGIFVLLIAAEEISWGQRIFRTLFHISIAPDALLQVNAQGEFNFHNIGVLDSLNRDGLHRGAGYLLLAWTVVSAAVSLLKPNLSNEIEKAGFPLIPIRLSPLFLLVPYFFLIRPLPHGSEIGELFLGIAVLTWAADLFFRYGIDTVPRGGKAVSLMSGVYISCVILTVALTWVFPGGLQMRLNRLAAHSYPSYGMYDQAEQLYAYIYANPQYLRPETRINHVRMLFELDQEERGHKVLQEALSNVKNGPALGQRSGEYLRHKGIIYSLLGETNLAKRYFTEAIDVDRQQSDLADNPEDKAQLMWSAAETLEAKGELAMALQMARLAKETAVSAKLSGRLDRWILDLNDRIASNPPDDTP